MTEDSGTVKTSDILPAVDLRFFGSFAYTLHGISLPPPRPRKLVLLLALLLLRSGRSVERRFLAETLWGDSDPVGAMLNLRRLLSDLRDYLGTEAKCLESPTRATLRFVKEPDCVDVLRFDALVRQHAQTGDIELAKLATQLQAAGSFLEGFHETWVVRERSLRETACLHLLDTLATHFLRCDDFIHAEAAARQAVSFAPLREPSQRLLYESLTRGGDPAAALRAFHAFRDQLLRDANQRPTPETLALIERIRAGATVPLRRSETKQIATRQEKLPRYPGSWIGRDAERASLLALLSETDTPLLTIVGIGGTGKTRLAVAAAQTDTARNTFPGGAFFVDLSPLPAHASADVIWQVLVDTFGITLAEQENPRQVVPKHLAERVHPVGGPLLLLLDNAEHLPTATTEVIQALLTETAASVRLLVTSRVSLGIPGESIYPLAPLSPLDARVLLQTRLQTVLSVPLQIEDVDTLCRRLDYLPLALELAAARLRVLPLKRVIALLDDRFRLLSSANTAVPARQRTMEATIAWSWNLLSPEEQEALARLSILPGGFDSEMASTIAGADDLMLAALTDQSLLQHDGTERYQMLESIRAFAILRRVELSNDTTTDRLVAWSFSYTNILRDGIWGERGGYWMERTRMERENLRAALEAASFGTALHMLHDMYQFWWRRSEWHEGLQAIAVALSKSARDTDTTEETQEYLLAAYTHRAYFHRFLGESHDLEARLRDHIVFCRKIGNKACVYLSHSLGDLLAEENRLEEALEWMQFGLEFAYRFDDEPLVGYQLRGLGRIHYRCDNAQIAYDYVARSIAIFRSHYLPGQLVLSLHDQGKTLLRLAKEGSLPVYYREASTVLTEALELARTQGARDMEGDILSTLIQVCQLLGDFDRVDLYGIALRTLAEN